MNHLLLAASSGGAESGNTHPIWVWLAFTAFIVAMLVLDLVVHSKSEGTPEDPHTPPFRSSVIWSIFWTLLALAFTLVLIPWMGGKHASEYITGYVIERSLSLDNLFVFTILFSFFAVPIASQRKVLFYGIIGAIVLRAIFILVGGALLETFHWMIYVFGVFLVITGIRMATHDSEEVDPEKNPILKLLRKVVPLSDDYEGSKIFTKKNGKRMATPMFAALAMVATFDVVFAIDSIPAIFAVTRDTFIVFAANAFALLGLTSLFFLVAGLLERFHYLNYGLAFILTFVGAKMLLTDVWHMPIWISLVVIIGTLLVAAWASRRWPKDENPEGTNPPSTPGPTATPGPVAGS
ncbi:TerC family protein [Patulibacter americanus]|uniref:TerC family protein n=1 Tax=Patulibacter americanus TaxID=588672 RepID=UPI0003B31CFF|nr:TerC family protein [Patulibacter americanus]